MYIPSSNQHFSLIITFVKYFNLILWVLCEHRGLLF